MKVADILKATKGKLLSGDASADINLASISTDSRTIKKGEFFLPLKGNSFDGEKFTGDALKKGAIGAFVGDSWRTSGCRNKIIIKVRNTTKALQQVAGANRMKFNVPVIGVTGSNGKTTTKDIIHGVLSAKFKG